MNQSSDGYVRALVERASDRLEVSFSAIVLCAALFMLLIPSAAYSEGEEDPLSQYRVLDWEELVPEGWEPPLVAEAYGENETAHIDEGSVVAFDQQLAVLPGFMKPKVLQGNLVSEFLLVPFLPQHIRKHAHLDANQMVYVYLEEPLQVENPFDPLWVVGTISQEAVMTDEGPAAYRFIGATTTHYDY